VRELNHAQLFNENEQNQMGEDQLPTPSVLKYKQKSLFRFIHLMMYVIHIVDHIHH